MIGVLEHILPTPKHKSSRKFCPSHTHTHSQRHVSTPSASIPASIAATAISASTAASTCSQPSSKHFQPVAFVSIPACNDKCKCSFPTCNAKFICGVDGPRYLGILGGGVLRARPMAVAVAMVAVVAMESGHANLYAGAGEGEHPFHAHHAAPQSTVQITAIITAIIIAICKSNFAILLQLVPHCHNLLWAPKLWPVMASTITGGLRASRVLSCCWGQASQPSKSLTAWWW